MKREIAATIFSTLLVSTAFAGPIETSQLPPPPAQTQGASDQLKLRGLIEDALGKKQTPSHTITHENWEAFSAELWLEGIPETDGISLDELARKAKPRVVEEPDRSIPTTLGWNSGNWKANLGANVTTATATPTVIPVDTYAGSITPSGGTGAIDGRVEYDLYALQFYGGAKRNLVANADGTLAANHNFSGGTYYNLPPSLFGGKIGTGLEVNPVGDSKTTKLEYRQMFGNTEGFLSAERTTAWQTHPGLENVTGTNALKGGFNRKF